MITKIITQLKTGTIKNVVFFGSTIPSSPYIVVKQESDQIERGTAFRIIVHMLKGQNIFLEDYVRNTIPTLLDNFEATSRHGNINKLEQDDFGSLPELVISNDDGTISMERLYFMPDKW